MTLTLHWHWSFEWNHGLKNNTRLSWLDSSILRRKRACDDITGSQKIVVLQCCVWLLAEMPSSRAVFDLNNFKSGVNMHLRFCQFPKNSEVCRVGCVLFIKPWHHTLHISELKYATTHCTFPSFLESNKTAGAFSPQICDYLSQIQRETKAFLLIVRHNTEGPPFSDCQWRHRMLFFFVGLKNRVNLVLFFKPWMKHWCLLSR